MEPTLNPTAEPLLVVLLGPTGSGKTELSLRLAEAFGGEIVNADSVAMYRDFEVGTAKPLLADQVRAPHHLLDCVDPDRVMSAGNFARMAREKIAEIASRKSLPIIVGGSGLYLRALVQGLFAGPERSEELRAKLRQRASEKAPGHLLKILRRLDPVAAQRIHLNDEPKLIRAIEVCLASRQQMTALWKQGRDPLRGFRILRLGLNPERQLLYSRINQRAQNMFDAGLVEETERLLAKYGAAAWPFSSLGYRQAVQFLHGEGDLQSAIAAVQQAHRNYAKRQMTWFRREPEIQWLPGFGGDAEIQRAAVEAVGRALVLPGDACTVSAPGEGLA